jgi:hypothetical protein
VTRFTGWVRAWTVAGTVAAVLAGGPAWSAPEILPHRALYTVSLGKAEQASGIADVRGRMAFEWRDVCDGWAVEQRYAMEFVRSEGDSSVIQSTYTTWEAKSGASYRFFVKRNRGDGEERVEGRASMPLPLGSAPGEVVFEEPDAESIALPADTLFPTLHTIRLIEAAVEGRRFLRAPVLDGSEVEAPSLISAVLGKARTDEPPIDADAVKGPYYPARLAWFGPDNDGPGSDFEMSVEILPNGIARGLTVDYDGFSVRMTLERLEELPKAEC